jgi:hypothetical protein
MAVQSQPNIKLDFETEAVWRNLRPEWFDQKPRASLNRAASAGRVPTRAPLMHVPEM